MNFCARTELVVSRVSLYHLYRVISTKFSILNLVCLHITKFSI
jgi:hypothetical protein